MSMFFVLVAVSVVSLAAQDKAIDTRRSTIAIHVRKSGLFSAAGHEHWINAPISAGIVNDSDAPHLVVRVDASRLEVKPDPKVDAKTQADIQRDMQQMVLQSNQYPGIVFRSTRVEKQAGGQWKVDGMLTLHGVTKPVVADAKLSDGAYTSHVVLKQTDFAIKPITVAGGLIKVKNELEIDFRIFARSD
jgi:polyisoprenoid-binding protein YceI